MLGRKMPLLSKINTKRFFWPHTDSGYSILCPGHPKHSQNHPGLAEGQPDGPLSEKIWLPSSKLTQKRKANLKDHWSKEIWPPSSNDCNPLDYFMWSEVERDVNKQ